MTQVTSASQPARPVTWVAHAAKDADRQSMPPQVRAARLRQEIFGSGDPVYALLDAAGIDGLPMMLAKHPRESCCLFSGKLQPGVAEAAPYLARIESTDDLTQALLMKGWGHAWGVIVVASPGAQFRPMRRHFRDFLVVRSPQGKSLFFRFYDPRVLRPFLPTCDAAQLRQLFGPVKSYICEGLDPDLPVRYRLAAGALVTEKVDLGTERS